MKVKNRIMYHIHVIGVHDQEWQVGNEIIIDENYKSYFGNGANEFDTCITVGKEQTMVSFDSFLKRRIDEFENLDSALIKRLLNTSVQIIKNTTIFSREMALENYRRDNCPHLLGRSNCVWLTNKRALEFWKKQFIDSHRLKIFKVMVTGELFKSSDAYIPDDELTYIEKYNAAQKYWNPPFDTNEAERKAEYLFRGKLKILEKIEEVGCDYMVIETPNKQDYQKVNALAVQVHELHVKWRPDLFNSVSNVILENEFEEMINNKEIFVGRLNDEVVGYISIRIFEKKYGNSKMRNKKVLEIDAMCVDEGHRGKGIGTKMLEFAKNIGLEHNCTDMYLTVNEENKSAIKTYEKFGMRIKNIAYSMQIGDK